MKRGKGNAARIANGSFGRAYGARLQRRAPRRSLIILSKWIVTRMGRDFGSGERREVEPDRGTPVAQHLLMPDSGVAPDACNAFPRHAPLRA